MLLPIGCDRTRCEPKAHQFERSLQQPAARRINSQYNLSGWFLPLTRQTRIELLK
ncbi:hypothetical protein QT971_15145 [Microcoleus sp. herbarium19]|uniref:hypothetical protein n=1 Tax=unclassified Microcoleus TaxID=2642155 RepID=UPI002FD424D9